MNWPFSGSKSKRAFAAQERFHTSRTICRKFPLFVVFAPQDTRKIWVLLQKKDVTQTKETTSEATVLTRTTEQCFKHLLYVQKANVSCIYPLSSASQGYVAL